jgi:hypothetical protein
MTSDGNQGDNPKDWHMRRSISCMLAGLLTVVPVWVLFAADNEWAGPMKGRLIHREGPMDQLMRAWLNLFLMSLICALLFVAFMALRPARAAEPGMQGNLPTPVQKLPTYPPVVCVATNWETEPCESRQTALPRRNPLRAFAASRPKTVLYDEPGGDYLVHWNRFRALAQSGDDVEIRGSCASSCTLVMVHVPNDRLCFGEHASLKFHVARDPKSGEPNMAFTQQRMVNQYPQDIYWWIKAKGGVEKMTIEQMWTLTAEELWAMGYHKCEPEEAPVPMKKTVTPDALKNYRAIWR